MSAIFITDFLEEYDYAYDHPFLTPVGQEFYRILGQAGWHGAQLPYKEISPMSMLEYWRGFPHQILSVFGKKSEVFLPRKSGQKLNENLPSLKFNNLTHFLCDEFTGKIEALHAELRRAKPNIIIPLGPIAAWAVGLTGDLSKLRGYLHPSTFGKILPTHHPSTILSRWKLRPILTLDLYKARRQSEYPEILTVSREIWTEPSLSDCETWWLNYGANAKLLAVDIETANGQIAEVGFASSARHALHIPFFWKEKQTWKSFYKTTKEETAIWRFISKVLASPIPKVGQNLKYDAYWLTKRGFYIHNWQEDTMVACHCWNPEFEKSLQALGSIFLDEQSWKSIRRQTEKEDE